MPRSPAPLPVEVYDLSTPEEIRTRKRRRLLIISLILALGLGVGGYFGARPAGRAIKGWQARRAASQADALIDAEAWREAQGKVQDACQLRVSEPAVMRAAGRFLTRVGHHVEAAEFWKQLESKRPLAPDEQRDFAIVNVALGSLDEAETRLRKAWPAGSTGTPDDWRIAMQIAARRHVNAAVTPLARKLATGTGTTPRQRLEGATAMVAFGNAAEQTEGWEAVKKLADDKKSPESLEALVLIARQVGSAMAATAAGKGDAASAQIMPAAEVAARLDAHPQAHVQHRLLALDIEAMVDPTQRASVIDRAIQRFAGGEPDELAALGAWLYAKGELQKVLAVIPEDKAVLGRASFLQYLDTLGALGRWADIEDLIKRQRFTLEPMIEQMYLARCSDQQGQTQARELHWNAAIAAAGSSVEKLMTVASYAARNGAVAAAETAYQAAIKADPEARPGYVGLLEIYQREGRTAALHELLNAMVARWPGDASVRNDAAFMGLLLGMDPAPILGVARDLVRESPGSLPHRVTLALAELRLGHALTALDAFAGIDMGKAGAQARQLAVYAAVLWDTSNEPEARQVLASIPANQLLPEEKALLDKITPQP